MLDSRTLSAKYTPFLLVAVLFFIPLSSSLKSVFIVLSTLALILTPYFRRQLCFTLRQSYCISAIILFLITLIACCWSEADYHIRFLFIEKYSKLLYLPLFMIGFQNKLVRKMGVYAFLLAMFITCTVSFFKYFNHITNPEKLFHDHISTSCMMAFAVYLSILMVIQNSGFKRILFLLLAILCSFQLFFINEGRIGYIIYVVLMVLLLIQYLPKKYFIVGMISFALTLGFCAARSSAFQTRLQQTITDWKHYQQGDKNTPIGMRLVFHHHAKSMFLASHWIGYGTGGFSSYYQQTNPLPAYRDVLEPHSQYWLIASEFGLLGLTALITFYGSLIVAAMRLNETKPIMLGLLACFFLSNLTDSQLLHSDIGYLFIVFSCLCLGEFVPSCKHVAIKSIQKEPVMSRVTNL